MSAKQITPAVRTIVAARSGGICELCGSRPATQIHHRCGRQMGGSREEWVNQASNLLHVCDDCHDRVTNTRGRREEVEEHGWLVRRGVTLPVEVPVRLWRGRVLLDDDGGYSHVAPESDDWEAFARCRKIDPELFFPEQSNGGGKVVEDARSVCFRCEVRMECLDTALARREEFGIWGGATFDERRPMLGRKRKYGSNTAARLQRAYIVDYLTDKGWRQGDVAVAVGVHQSTVSRLIHRAEVAS